MAPSDLPFPKSLPDFQRLFPDDAACASYLERLRWRPFNTFRALIGIGAETAAPTYDDIYSGHYEHPRVSPTGSDVGW